MSYQVLIPEPVQKQIELLPQKIQNRIIEKLLELKENPNPRGSKKMSGSQNEYRIRIGDYRLIYEINYSEFRIVTLLCKHRKDIYRN